MRLVVIGSVEGVEDKIPGMEAVKPISKPPSCEGGRKW
jgi:hypothetical protein